MTPRGLDINFAGTDYRLLGRIRAGLLGAGIVLGLMLGMIILSAALAQSDIAVLKRKIIELETADRTIQPVLVERDRFVKDLASMSALLDAKRFSWTRFLSAVEATVPLGVALERVAVQPRDGNVSLVGKALSPEALRNLMVGLEASRSFRQPFLKHQSLEKGSISFNVVARYYQEPAAAGAAGAAPPAGK